MVRARAVILVGFVQLVPPSLHYVRLLAAVIVTVVYLVLFLLLKPFKRDDVNALAMGSQSLLTCVFIAAQTLRLFNELSDVGLARKLLGFSRVDELVAMMILFNVAILFVFGTITVVQIASGRRVRILRLMTTNEAPDLSLSYGLKYHLFLSHIWSSGQDQVAVIKRQLQHLLPGVCIFLDVDDLADSSKLDRYIAASQCVLLFLSRGYFFSKACLIELDSTLQERKHLALVHEADTTRGGEPLDALRAACESRRPDAVSIFDEHRIIPWHRVADFQLLSLQLVAQELVHAMPEFHVARRAPELYMNGAITQQVLTMASGQSVVLAYSDANPGAAGVANELTEIYGDAGLRTHRLTSERSSDVHVSSPGGDHAGSPTARTTKLKRLPTTSTSSARPRATHLLIYLNEQTFVGGVGEELAAQVREARQQSQPVVLVHETDPQFGGCAFERLFHTTPQDLIDDGLYRKIAIACHPAPHRSVSLALIALALGMKESDNSLIALCSRLMIFRHRVGRGVVTMGANLASPSTRTKKETKTKKATAGAAYPAIDATECSDLSVATLAQHGSPAAAGEAGDRQRRASPEHVSLELRHAEEGSVQAADKE